jgi:HlyD family secretion protein
VTGDTELGVLFRDPFPEPEPATEEVVAARPSNARFHNRKRVTAIVLVVALAGAGVGIWAATGSSAATYRWTTVTKADVDQTLDSYGTVTPIHQANVAFPVSGTVATIPVTVGQQVKAGQALATLQTSSLQSRLDSAKSALATAQAKLVSDEAAEASGTTVSATTTSATLDGADTGHATPLTPAASPSPAASGRSGAGSASSADSAVTAAQSKLLADQHAVDQLTGVVAADLRTGMTTCASLIQSLKNLSVTPASTMPPASPSATGAQVPDTTACTDLLNKILADQQAVTAAQTTVSNDETALTTAVNTLAAQAKTGSGPTSGSNGGSSTSRSDSGSTGSSNSFSGTGRTSSGGGGGGTTVTAEQLVVDQATVDADAANAIVAAEALNQATLVSPLSGTVAAINISPGTTASASTTAITVIGPGADQVSTTITDLQLKEVHLGSDASVIPDGSTTPVHGTVTAIGLLPVSSTSSSSSSRTSSSSSTSSSATYPVTISLDTSGLYSGSGADVSIVVKKLSNVLAVPTSAVTGLGALHTVMVQSGGKAKRQIVVVGASDASYTQITSGLTSGERVALAQVNLPVPSSGSTTNLARLAGGGGVGRGTFTRGGAGGTGTTGATRTGG